MIDDLVHRKPSRPTGPILSLPSSPPTTKHFTLPPTPQPRGLAHRTEGFSGADLANLLRRAALHALAESSSAAESESEPAAPAWEGRDGGDDGGGDGGDGGRPPCVEQRKKQREPAQPDSTVVVPRLAPRHLEAALAATRPSMTAAQLGRYRAFARRHGHGQGGGGRVELNGPGDSSDSCVYI